MRGVVARAPLVGDRNSGIRTQTGYRMQQEIHCDLAHPWSQFSNPLAEGPVTLLSESPFRK